jgi:dolichyl-phosphate beta-glucosyltransferase
MGTPRLSLIFPAYNEAKSIGRTLGLAFDWLDTQGYDYEIIVSADGEDGTREAARALGEERGKQSKLTVIGETRRAGKGRGIRAGVKVARGEIIGFSDADNKTPIEELTKILPYFDDDYDVVIGSRAEAGSDIKKRQPLYRRLGSKGFALAMHVTTGLWHVKDTQCGFKFFRGDVARDLFARQTIDGYMFDVEILALAKNAGYRLREVGIKWQDDGDSRLDLVAGNWRNMRDLLQIAYKTRVVAPR